MRGIRFAGRVGNGKAAMLGGLLAAFAATVLVLEVLAPGDPLQALELPALALLISYAIHDFLSRRAKQRALEAAFAAKEALASDIAARTRIEKELRQTQDRLELTQQLTKSGLYENDLATGKALWSRGMWSLLGIEPRSADPTDDLFASCVHPEDREETERIHRKAIESRTDFESEFRVCHPDGAVRWLFARGTAVYDVDGNPQRLSGVALDVTDRRAADGSRASLEAQLRQAQKMEAVGQLAGGIAHDFNNLLLALRGYGELALRATARGEDASEDVREMLDAADRATALTGQLLAFSRRQMLQPRVIDMHEVVAEMKKLLAQMIGDDIRLEVSDRQSPVWVNADPGQLEQVIANMAVNARDAMPGGGLLRLDVSAVTLDGWHGAAVEPGRYALLCISDTGTGMDNETASQVFEPFFTTKEGVGTGLGLATVHGIVKQTGGHIWVYSEPGHGTTFKIYLPLAAEERALLPEPEPEPVVGGEETVLLVEDDADVRTIISLMLEERGYRVVTAADGDEAVSIAGRLEGLDILLTDVVMHGLSGRETADRVRELQSDLVVVYMSGYTDDAVVRRGVLSAGTAFIQKPFSSDELARKLRAALDGRDSGPPDLSAQSDGHPLVEGLQT
jgi:two-component system, cell cycle sensor histidine kinase and response regulator CckA